MRVKFIFFSSQYVVALFSHFSASLLFSHLSLSLPTSLRIIFPFPSHRLRLIFVICFKSQQTCVIFIKFNVLWFALLFLLFARVMYSTCSTILYVPGTVCPHFYYSKIKYVTLIILRLVISTTFCTTTMRNMCLHCTYTCHFSNNTPDNIAHMSEAWIDYFTRWIFLCFHSKVKQKLAIALKSDLWKCYSTLCGLVPSYSTTHHSHNLKTLSVAKFIDKSFDM